MPGGFEHAKGNIVALLRRSDRTQDFAHRIVQFVLLILPFHTVVQDGAHTALGQLLGGLQAFGDVLATAELLEDGGLDQAFYG